MKIERRKPIHDIFPITEQAATEATRAITVSERDLANFPLRFKDMAMRIRKENPEVVSLLFAQLALLDFVTDQADPGHEADIWLGAIYGYEALKKEAQVRGGRLPVINSGQILTYTRDHIVVGEAKLGIEVMGASIGRNLEIQMGGLNFYEPHFVEGFRTLIRELQVGESSQRTAFGSAYQMYAIFKTHSEIQKVRQMAR